MNSWTRFVSPFMLFLTAFAVRLLSWHSVFQDGGAYPNGNDAYYHLRRIRYSVENFPDVLRFDPLMNFPEGAQAIWPPTFDWLIAALARVFVGVGSPDELERFVLFIPPALGAATVVLVYALALHFFSRTVATIAGLSMAILPAHSLYSRLGAVDHHVLVTAVVAVMLWLAMRLFVDDRAAAPHDQDPADGENAASTVAAQDRYGLSAMLGFVMAAAVLVWPGSLLQVGVLQVAFVIRLLTTSDQASAQRWARRFAVVHAVALVTVVPMSLGNVWQVWGPFSPVVLSNFHPTYFLAAAAAFGISAALWHRGWGGADRRARVRSALLVGGALILGLLAVVPDLLGAILDALSWFAKEEDFQSVVNESAPLFGGARGLARARGFLGYFVYLAPPAFAYFSWTFRSRPEVLFLLGWGLALYLATLVQWRFMNAYSIAHCLLIGLFVETLFLEIGRRMRSVMQRRLAIAASIVVVMMLFAPAVRSYRLEFANFGRSLRGETTVPIGAQLKARFVADAARFLKAHSPRGNGPFAPADYSVLGPWGDGHILKAVGERAVVQDNFGDDVAPENFARAEAYFSATTEAAALEILEPLRTRYVLVRSTGSGQADRYSFKSMLTRLYRLRGNGGSLPGVGGGELEVGEALARHRLIYQSRPLVGSGRQPYVMIFEIVPGAEVVGQAAPDSLVEATVDVTPQDGARFQYRASVKADKAGRYRLRLPYSTGSLGPNVRTGSRYTLASGGRTSRLVVSDSAVYGEAPVGGPTFSRLERAVPKP